MQPYLFPYLGYFQLMAASDKFVVYDDVSYIKQGWINRNRILVNGAPHSFTMPVMNAGSNVDIDQIRFDQRLYASWRTKFLRTLAQAYGKAPFKDRTIALITDILAEEPAGLSGLLSGSLQRLRTELGIPCEIVPGSSVYRNKELRSAARILDICKQEKADVYINAFGGQALYDRAEFEHNGIGLEFLKSRLPFYEQGTADFVPGLSIIDVLMHCDMASIHAQLEEYELI